MEELEENSEQHDSPAVCICFRGFVPLKREKDIKPRLLDELCLSQGKFASPYSSWIGMKWLCGNNRI